MALPFVLFPSAITNSMAVLLLPYAAQARAQGNERRIGAMVSMSLRYSCYMGILCIGLFTMFGEQLGQGVFHDQNAGFFIAALSWLCPFMYLASTMGSILNGLGKTSVTFFLNVTAMMIRLAFVLFAIPSFGILGYLWGMLASELILALMCCLSIRRLAYFPWDGANMIAKPALFMLISIGIYLASPAPPGCFAAFPPSSPQCWTWASSASATEGCSCSFTGGGNKFSDALHLPYAQARHPRLPSHAIHSASLVVEIASAPAESAAMISFLSEISPPAIRGISVYPRISFNILGIMPGMTSTRSGWNASICFLVVARAMESMINALWIPKSPVPWRVLPSGVWCL